MKLRVFLIDDESLALKRLARLLVETGRVKIIGQTTEPLEALEMIPNLKLDAVFLDIQMPELNGFDLLKKLTDYPPVIFTTAFDEFALRAFDVYSVDYLLKPVESERLTAALEKLEKLKSNSVTEATANIEKLLKNLSPDQPTGQTLERIASRIGGKVKILETSGITHFFARDKMTFAKTFAGGEFPVDDSLNRLEEKLDPKTFLRIHRSSIVNLKFIEEVHGWFSGRVLIRLKDSAKTELVVARERVKILKEFLGM